jgi:hypothetical protein
MSKQFIQVLHSPHCNPSSRQNHEVLYIILHILFPSTRKLSFQDWPCSFSANRVAENMFVLLRHGSYCSDVARGKFILILYAALT